MFPQWSSLLRRTILTTAALVLGLSAVRSTQAQTPVPTGDAAGYGQVSPSMPASSLSSGSQASTSAGTSASTPVLTPGYFEVVCPAICYGGAFHVFGHRAYGGAGYYGPFRRYWAYSTYGPNYNIGPDNSQQFGLQSGVMYVAMRRGKGLCKHGTDPCAYAGAVPPVGGTGVPPAGGASPQPAEGPARQPPSFPRGAGEREGGAGNTAHLRLVVPENAEVLVEGRKTTTTGTVRDFVSPPLDPGKNMIYSVLVRYTDAGGKTIEETHSVRVRANDRLHIDCTKSASTEPRVTVQRP